MKCRICGYDIVNISKHNQAFIDEFQGHQVCKEVFEKMTNGCAVSEFYANPKRFKQYFRGGVVPDRVLSLNPGQAKKRDKGVQC